ncbi:MAG: DNA (cytosine-5-)-methyltransferase [Candidatus Omnitrophica bacterium]|nr:DNA (cytosine-5-)-methyltransferase [Candidatus Omnitrophota bacterium]
MRVVDFFSGIGGLSLGLERVGFQTVAFSEVDPYACAVLKKHWPDVPNLGDITTLQPGTIPEADLWCGGFPCQPFSVAGARRGSEDRRHLWPSFARLIGQVRPRWLFLENVPGLLSVDAGRVFGGLLRDLASCGYVVEWDCLPASAFGAPHRRDRLWIVAYSNSRRQQERSKQDRTEKEPKLETSRRDDPCGCGQDGRPWDAEPAVGRVVDELPRRVDRLRCLGNAVVPAIPQWIGSRIRDVETMAEVYGCKERYTRKLEPRQN